jgi:cytochrome c oxidase subunit 2
MDPRRIFGHIFGIETAIAAVVFVLICATVAVALLLSHRRRRRGAAPSRVDERTRVELSYAAAVGGGAGIVVAISFNAIGQERTVQPRAAAKVDITGFQWCWSFAYPGSRRTVTGTCDNGDLPTMVVPVGQPITLRITSSDVIHSWWVPSLRYKLDAFPNHTNSVTIKLDRAGRWIGRCAEFCGHQHTWMDFYLKAVPADQYRQWLGGAAA